MKVGDKIYCHTEIESYRLTNKNWFSVGKIYTIINVNKKYFTLIDDEGDKYDMWMFTFDNYFYNVKKSRKLKLNKIDESRR